ATSRRQPAKELKYIFANLVRIYGNISLKSCNSDSQSQRPVDSLKAAKRLAFFHLYMLELTNLSLASYSLCSRYYMQIVINNHFYKLFSDSYQGQESEEKKLNARIERMQQYLKNQKNEVEELKKLLQNANDNINVIQGLYEKQRKNNEKQIDLVIEIARAEYGMFFDDIKIQLAILAIKYSIAQSKMFDELLKYEELLPKGLLFLAFDNEQKGQKNYLDQKFNTAYSSLNRSQYKELFNINFQMQKIIDEELHTYLDKIIMLLSKEKSSTNVINFLAASISVDITKSKFCFKVNIPEIYIPDPINLNPNLVASVEQILLHIEKISGIKDGI
ncbi:1522_t:CDS:2, partial [Scutellospora calospora]